MLTAEAGAELDDLLSRWHHWQQGDHAGARGFNCKALVVGDFRISRQYDDSNGQLDADLEDRTMRQVDHAARELTEPFRSAIYAHARACYLGLAVFSSPRLPQDRQARDRIVAQARASIARRLVDCGVMQGV